MDSEPDVTASEVGHRRRRRRTRTGLLAAAGVLVAAAVAAASVGFGLGGDPQVTASPPASATTPVVRETLTDYVTVDGLVGFGEPQPVACKAAGTVTWLAPAGSTVDRGKPLLRVDDQPIVLLFGALPMYRALSSGVKGKDVLQLEQNLRALGYQGFTVDEEFSAATAPAVKRWQRDSGMTETGAVAAEQVIYAAGPLHIAQQLVRTGATATADVLAVTGTTRVVTSAVAAAEAGWAAVDAKVVVELPSGVSTPGRVVGVQEGPASTEGGSGSNTATQITIAVEDQAAMAGIDRGRVIVRHAVHERQDVLTVPVAALLALAEGGYGLEVVEGGSSRLVAAQVGLFAGGRVEVSGPDVREGMTVRMPR